MKGTPIIAMFSLLSISFLEAQDVQGELDVIQGQTILKVWGTHYEMGYAQGYLTGEQGLAFIEEYVIGHLCGGATGYNSLRGAFDTYFTVDSIYLAEAEGGLQGMTDAGVDIHLEALGRNLEAEDILTCNCMPDMNALVALDPLGCSSLSGWGESTEEDSILSGGLVIARNLDFSPDLSIYRSSLITAYMPSDSGEQNWISVGFMGLMGCLSGLNEGGFGALLNMSNHPTITSYAPPFTPILLALRTGIERYDYDGDGVPTKRDIHQAVRDRNRASSYAIHVISMDAHEQADTAAFIIECNNAAGDTLRFSYDDTLLNPHTLIVTNHDRILYPPEYCYRYLLLQDSLEMEFRLTSERAWTLVGEAGTSSTLQTMIFRPDSLDLFFAHTDSITPSYIKDPVHLPWDSLFDVEVVSENRRRSAPLMTSFSVRPNPVRHSTSIVLQSNGEGSQFVSLDLYDVRGRLVRPLLHGRLTRGTRSIELASSTLKPGVYLCVLSTDRITEVRRITVLR
jgi:hypothetical protein